MKKKHLIIATVVALSASTMMQSCIGSFALYSKVKDWNDNVGSKFVNELVFVAMWILPVYELSLAQTKVVDGKDAQYLVASNEAGYTITNLKTKQKTRFNFNAQDNSWSIENNGEEVKLFSFVDDNHVNVLTRDGSYSTVELSHSGVLAYQQLIGIGAPALALK